MSEIMDSRMFFVSGGATHPGKVRPENEDAFVVLEKTGLWAVTDGMGGHEAGAFASSEIAASLAAIEPAASAAALLSACDRRLEDANRRIRDHGEERGGVTVGATVAVLLVFAERYACVWCGDSRIYLVRDGKIRQLSRDHTEVQALVDRGALTQEEAKTWPNRNILTRAIGVFDEPETEMVEGCLQSGDVFVLCSDGLTLHVEDAEIAQIATRRPAANSCDDLIALALARGGRDNVTVVIAQYRPEATRPALRFPNGRGKAP
jgi:serine/threonine protein phosphatase PrpC